MKAFGGECVYAVEIDRQACPGLRAELGPQPLGDVTHDATMTGVMNVPPTICSARAFRASRSPSRARSAAWTRLAAPCSCNIPPSSEAHHPKVVLLENVRNLVGPRHVHEWHVIIETLRDEGYRVSETAGGVLPHRLPPSMGGRPQVRERVFITATHDPTGLGLGLRRPEPVAS